MFADRKNCLDLFWYLENLFLKSLVFRGKNIYIKIKDSLRVYAKLISSEINLVKVIYFITFIKAQVLKNSQKSSCC